MRLNYSPRIAQRTLVIVTIVIVALALLHPLAHPTLAQVPGGANKEAVVARKPAASDGRLAATSPRLNAPTRNTANSAAAADVANTDDSRQSETFLEVLKIARQGVQQIDGEIRDYSCVLIKRERVEGRLGDYHYMMAKVRHKTSRSPFSLYLRFLKPDEVEDREVLYVDGANEGKIVAKKGGYRFSTITTLVNPESELAMQGNRYPITEFGVQNLAHKLLEIAEDEQLLQDFDIELRRQSKVDKRDCLLIEVKKRKQTEGDKFYTARVFIDKELMVPIHFEAYDWPRRGGEPRLLEQYTYRNLKLNVGLTASDFDRNNPAYGFRKTR